MQDTKLLQHWLYALPITISRKWDTIYATMPVSGPLETYMDRGTLCGKGETIEAALGHLQDILQDKLRGRVMQDEILTTFAGRDAIGLSTVKGQCQHCSTTGQLYAFWVHMPHPHGFTNGNMREGKAWVGSGSSDWWGDFCGEGCFQEYSAGRKYEVEQWEKVMQDGVLEYYKGGQ